MSNVKAKLIRCKYHPNYGDGFYEVDFIEGGTEYKAILFHTGQCAVLVPANFAHYSSGTLWDGVVRGLIKEWLEANPTNKS